MKFFKRRENRNEYCNKFLPMTHLALPNLIIFNIQHKLYSLSTNNGAYIMMIYSTWTGPQYLPRSLWVYSVIYAIMKWPCNSFSDCSPVLFLFSFYLFFVRFTAYIEIPFLSLSFISALCPCNFPLKIK